MWTLWLLLFVPAAILQAVYHEAAHALMALAFDAEIKSVTPWPHRASNGYVCLARVQYEWAQRPSERAAQMTSFAPMAAGLLPLALLSPLGAWPSWVLSTCAAVDVFRGFGERFWGQPYHDINRVSAVASSTCAFAMVAVFTLWSLSTLMLGIKEFGWLIA